MAFSHSGSQKGSSRGAVDSSPLGFGLTMAPTMPSSLTARSSSSTQASISAPWGSVARPRKRSGWREIASAMTLLCTRAHGMLMYRFSTWSIETGRMLSTCRSIPRSSMHLRFWLLVSSRPPSGLTESETLRRLTAPAK